MFRLNFLRRKKIRKIQLEDIILEVERARNVEVQREQLEKLYNFRDKLIIKRIKELLTNPAKGSQLIKEYRDWLNYKKILEYYNGGQIDYEDLAYEIREAFGYNYKILSDGQKRALIQAQDKVLTLYIFPKLHGIDDKNGAELIQRYKEAIKNLVDLEGAELDEIIELQDYLLKWGWRREEVEKPIIAVIQLPPPPIIYERGPPGRESELSMLFAEAYKNEQEST